MKIIQIEIKQKEIVNQWEYIPTIIYGLADDGSLYFYHEDSKAWVLKCSSDEVKNNTPNSSTNPL